MPDDSSRYKIIEYAFVIILALFAGYYVAAIYGYGDQSNGLNLVALSAGLTQITEHPLRNYWNLYTLKMMAVGIGAALLWIAYDASKPNKYRIGKEYGSAEWGNVKALSRRLADKDKGNNKIFSQHLRISMDTHKTMLNNNSVTVGGSGAGKSLFLVSPNLYYTNVTDVCTDPKGELLARHGEELRKRGYIITVLNLINPDKSNGYNPFRYIRTEEDIDKLAHNFMENTSDKKAARGDAFWTDNAESLFSSVALYVWKEESLQNRNLPRVADLISDPTELKIKMDQLPENHPAKIKYLRVLPEDIPEETAGSIRSTLLSRLRYLTAPKIRRLLEKDEMDIPSLGVGHNGDGKTRTAVFLVIPDQDKTYNFIIGMYYTQLFQELYYQADFVYNGSLPIPVSIWMDEFANVSLPDNFVSAEATMRSRNISVNVIIQNLTQLKALFKDDNETILGNADTFVYLGGNEPTTYKYVSERLGIETIDKKSDSRSRGGQGSFSESHDRMQHNLLSSAEVGLLPRNKCIIFVKGENPIMDKKYNTLKDDIFLAFSKSRYKHTVDIKRDRTGKIISGQSEQRESFEVLTPEGLEYYRAAEEAGDNVVVYDCDLSALIDFDESQITMSVREKYYHPDEAAKLVYDQSAAAPKQGQLEKENKHQLLQAIIQNDLSAEQREQVILGYQNGLTEDEVALYCRASYSVERMKAVRELLETERGKISK